MKKSKGFTLIELLIVMAVIAILIAIAIPSFRGMQQEARKTKAQGDLRVLKIAIESYYKNHANVYPALAVDGDWEGVLTAASPAIINNALMDPFAAANVQYQYALSTADPATARYYVVWSIGPNAIAGACTVSNATGVVTPADATIIYDTNGR
jgi:prepilin-type N-terminal cleavage/methylation domain-containing protein